MFKEKMMSFYTPTQIIDAGIRDTRETFADLYVELATVNLAADAAYHHAFVDRSEEITFHPAPAGFGGNEVALRETRIDMARLTTAGMHLYIAGTRTALAERDELCRRIAHTNDSQIRLQLADNTQRELAAELNRATDAANYRAKRDQAAFTPPTFTAWADAPVRIPGTTEYIR